MCSSRTAERNRLAIWIGNRILLLDTGTAGAPAVTRTLTAEFSSSDLSRVQFSANGDWLLVHRRGYDPLLFDLDTSNAAGIAAAVSAPRRLHVSMAQFTDDGRWLIVAAFNRGSSSNLEVRVFPLRDTDYSLVASRVLEGMHRPN